VDLDPYDHAKSQPVNDFASLEYLPQQRDTYSMKCFIANFECPLGSVKPPLDLRSRLRYTTLIDRLPLKSLSQYHQRSSWNRGTKIVFNQTTELNLRLNEIQSWRSDKVPEIVRLILMPYCQHNMDVTEDAVWLILEKVWTGQPHPKVLAQVCHKAFNSPEYDLSFRTVSPRN
jgi:hypothetical protein